MKRKYNSHLLYIVIGMEQCDCCGHYKDYSVDSIHLTEQEAKERIKDLEDEDNYEYYHCDYEWDIYYDYIKLNRIRIEED